MSETRAKKEAAPGVVGRKVSEQEWYRRLGRAYLQGFEAGIEGRYVVLRVSGTTKKGADE